MVVDPEHDNKKKDNETEYDGFEDDVDPVRHKEKKLDKNQDHSDMQPEGQDMDKPARLTKEGSEQQEYSAENESTDEQKGGWELEPVEDVEQHAELVASEDHSVPDSDESLKVLEPGLPGGKNDVENEDDLSLSRTDSLTPGKGWAEAEPPVSAPFFLNWQDRIFHFKDKRIESDAEISDSKTFCYAFFDFPEEDGPGKIQVSGEAKYAHVLARKQAEQRGDLGPESVFHVYRNFKTNKNESEVLYHIIPRAHLEKARSACHVPAGCVLMDWTGLLFSLLEKGGRKDQAIALHADSSVLLMVGNAHKIHHIRRYPFYSEASGELDNLMVMMEQDLMVCQEEKNAGFSELQWIEVFASEQPEELPEIQIPVQPWPLARYIQDSAVVWTSLPFLMDAIDPKFALSGAGEKYIRPLQLMEKWVWLILIIGAASLGTINWINLGLEKKLNIQAATLEDQINNLEQEIQGYSYDVLGENEVSEVLNLVNDLRRAAEAPSPVTVWNSFLNSWPSSWEINSLTFSYDEENIEIQADGVMNNNPRQAEKQSRVFRQALVQKGFVLRDTGMILMAEQADFNIRAIYPWSEF